MEEKYRILIPSEYQKLLDAIEKERLRVVVEAMMNTGMRYSELLWMSTHIKSFDSKNNAITLPRVATKTKRDRVVHITPAFSKRLYLYLREHKTIEAPVRRTMDTNLIRWWRNIPEYDELPYPATKTFRKTWESWLLASGYFSMAVALSQGHSQLISYSYYATLDPRLKSEMDQVRKLTEGWGT